MCRPLLTLLKKKLSLESYLSKEILGYRYSIQVTAE